MPNPSVLAFTEHSLRLDFGPGDYVCFPQDQLKFAFGAVVDRLDDLYEPSKNRTSATAREYATSHLMQIKTQLGLRSEQLAALEVGQRLDLFTGEVTSSPTQACQRCGKLFADPEDAAMHCLKRGPTQPLLPLGG